METTDPDGIMETAECKKCLSNKMQIMSIDYPSPAIILYGKCMECGHPFKIFYSGEDM